MQQSQTHLFSIYAPNLKLNSWSVDQLVTLHDAEVIHRLSKVLRFEVGDTFIFFDTKIFAKVTIQENSKKNIQIKVLQVQTHQTLMPHVTFLLPLLKKEALEQAVYSLCELGINKIQLVITQKSRQSLLHEKEFARLQAIVIAAAEQSKNYNLSELVMPQKLSEIVNIIAPCFNIVFDPAGASFFDLREKLFPSSSTEIRDPIKLKKSYSAIALLVGPEGGLTDQELSLLQKSGFVSCALTPTILTAVQAVALGAGLMRLK